MILVSINLVSNLLIAVENWRNLTGTNYGLAPLVSRQVERGSCDILVQIVAALRSLEVIEGKTGISDIVVTCTCDKMSQSRAFILRGSVSI